MTHAEATALDVMGAAAPDGWTTDYTTGVRTPFYSEYQSGYSETPCSCGQHWGVSRKNGRCLACNATPGLWLSIATENAVDDRDHRANDRAEEQEEREREEEEWLYEQALLQTEGERCPPF